MKQYPDDDYLPELVPEYKELNLTYEIHWTAPPPKEGEYMVSIGRRTKQPGTLYQVVSCVRMFPKNCRPHTRKYKLKVIKVPEMKVHLVYDQKTDSATVKHTTTHIIYWNPRNKK